MPLEGRDNQVKDLLTDCHLFRVEVSRTLKHIDNIQIGCIYTIILLIYVSLSPLANCRSQFLLDRLGRCLKLFVSTESISSHDFACQFGIAIFFICEKHPKTIANSELTVSAVMADRHRSVGLAAATATDRTKTRVYTFTPGGALRDKSHICLRRQRIGYWPQMRLIR